MKPITYLTGDATQPATEGRKIIAHICNDQGGWGRGFVMALSNRWKEPEQAYRQWHATSDSPPFELGRIQLVEVDPLLRVANMIGQHGIHVNEEGTPPIRYEAVESCLQKLAEYALTHQCSVHMPRIGCGLAGGTWDEIEPLITRTCCAADVPVYVYDFE